MSPSADHHGRALDERIGDVRLDLGDGGQIDEGTTWTPGSVPGPTFRARTRSANFRANTSKIPSDQEAVGASAGLAGVAELGGQRPLDGLLDVGVIEDEEGGVSSNSSEIFLIVSALWRIRIRPTSVEPVKVILRTCRLSVSVSPISAAEPVTTLKAPFGTPASWARAAKARARMASATPASRPSYSPRRGRGPPCGSPSPTGSSRV